MDLVPFEGPWAFREDSTHLLSSAAYHADIMVAEDGTTSYKIWRCPFADVGKADCMTVKTAVEAKAVIDWLVSNDRAVHLCLKTKNLQAYIAILMTAREQAVMALAEAA